MFATLLGGLPRPPVPRSTGSDAILDVIVDAQAAAGLELICDAGWAADPADPVDSWRATASRTSLPVKAVVPGPLTSGLRIGGSVEDLRRQIAELADAGCPWVEIAEPAATGIGGQESERERFLDLHERLLAGLEGVHLSIAITGGSADIAGAETILGPPYASLAVDLIAGPDNWRLVAAAGPERGIVCGALSPLSGSDDGPEILLWAVAHAASRRGIARVGIASASSLTALSWEAAVAKMRRLGEVARLAAMPGAERRTRLDPRSIDIRTAAMGHPRPERHGDRAVESQFDPTGE